jgi:hypothetical protein
MLVDDEINIFIKITIHFVNVEAKIKLYCDKFLVIRILYMLTIKKKILNFFP